MSERRLFEDIALDLTKLIVETDRTTRASHGNPYTTDEILGVYVKAWRTVNYKDESKSPHRQIGSDYKED